MGQKTGVWGSKTGVSIYSEYMEYSEYDLFRNYGIYRIYCVKIEFIFSQKNSFRLEF